MGVPAEAEWVKDLTAVAHVTVVAQVQSLAQELPYPSGVAKNNTTQNKTQQKSQSHDYIPFVFNA